MLFLVNALNISYGQIWLDIEVRMYNNCHITKAVAMILLYREHSIGVKVKKQIKSFLKNYYWLLGYGYSHRSFS